MNRLDSSWPDSPSYVSYVVTNKCVADCEFCLTPEKRGGIDLTTKEAKTAIDAVAASGAQMISFAGREPFLRRDIWELIRYAKQIGLLLNIESTGALLTTDKVNALLEFGVDWLSITADNFDRQLAKDMRRPFLTKDRLLMIAREFEKNPDSHLKVSSVTTAVTRPHLASVGGVLSQFPPEVWKLRQFTPRGQGNNNQMERKHSISSKEFRDIEISMRTQFPDLHIVDSKTDDYTGALIMITFDGRVIVPHGREDLYRGNIAEGGCSIRDVWQSDFSEADRILHSSNYKQAYLDPLKLTYCNTDFSEMRQVV